MEENFYKDYTANQVLNPNLLEEIFKLPPAQKEQLLAHLEGRARQLKILTNLKRLEKDVVSKMTSPKLELKETEFTRQPLAVKIPQEYVCSDSGIKLVKYDAFTHQEEEKSVCSHPIMPVERLVNIDTYIEKVKLAFYKDKKWQYLIAERNTLASKNKILQIANLGIEVNDNNAKELITFLNTTIQLNMETIPLNNAVTHLGWTDKGFVPYVKDFKFDGDKSFEGIFKDIRRKGDYELWKEYMRNLRRSETLHLIIAASFASPLIEKVHINSFILHLWGKSGTGKTIALMAAMSVWGNPKVGHLVKNLNSTNVGLERLAAFLNNIPFAGDELQAIKNRYTDFSELIYQLTQGEGKSRGTVDGGIQEQLKWSNLFLTTGEEPITSAYSKEGVKNRVIEVEENELIVENGHQVAMFLNENYGDAGRDFIENLPSTEYLIQRHAELFEKINRGSGKQANALALILLADEIVSERIFHDAPLTVQQISKYHTEDIDEADRIYELIVDYFYRNINKFSENSNTEYWGGYEEDTEGNIKTFFFIPSVLRDFLKENGISFDGIKDKLFSHGYIQKDNKGKYSILKKDGGRVLRVIKFNILGEEQQFNIEDLPF